VNFALFWMSSEGRSRYIYPLFPFLCYLIIKQSGHLDNQWFHRYLRIMALVLLVLVSLALPVVLWIQSLEAIPHLLEAVILAELLVATAWFFYFKADVRPFLIILSVVVIGKLMMSHIVPQSRMLQSNAAKDKQLAFDIAELTEGQKIYRWGDVRMSLTTVFYLERERQQVLYAKDNVDPGSFYFVYADQLNEMSSYEILLELSYHENKIYLLRIRPSIGK
jgi:hypothetical protein